MKITNPLKGFKNCTMETQRISNLGKNWKINTQGECNHNLGSVRDQDGRTQTIRNGVFDLELPRIFPQEDRDPKPFPLSSPFSLLNVATLFLFSQLLKRKSFTPQSGVWIFGNKRGS